MVRASGNAKRDQDIQMACGFFSPLLQVTAKLRYREQSEAGMLYEFLLGNVVRCLRLGEFRTADARARPAAAVERNVGRLHQEEACTG